MIPLSESIISYMHCAKCFAERPLDMVAPRDWARLSVGFTKIGIQVWCNRCNLNVIHIDFEGQKHPASMKVVSP